MKKAVLITGAQKGTGYGIAARFAKEGWNVIITSRDGYRAKAAADQLMQRYPVSAVGYECDKIHSESQIIEMFQDIDQQGFFVETMVLNAANLGFGSDPTKGMDFFTTPMAEVKDVFDTNLVWNYMLVRQAALRMKQHQKGSVVFISSNTAYRAIPCRSAYCASKGGIISLSKALAVELGIYGIRCNVILPGTIKTERWYAAGKKQTINGKLTLLGDISDYDDIANAVWYFGTDESKNVTGAELVVDSGMTCQLYPQILDTYLG